jgi:hypothetical protein
MGEGANIIWIFHTDSVLDGIIRSMDTGEARENFFPCFSYNEEFFLKLGRELEIPRFPIHHDVRNPRPDDAYTKSLRSVFSNIASLVPAIFRGLTYIFNPSNTFNPSFYALYRVDDRKYLYLLRIDLLFKPQYCEITERGTNDIAHGYATRYLFVDANFIPLDNVETDGNRVSAFAIRETISSTWIGEQGRGYFQQGIWMDNSLTNFFSRLFLAPESHMYPYFPFLCKYKTLCSHIISFLPEEREKELPYLHNALLFLEPEMRSIEEELKVHDFSPDLPVFMKLKANVPSSFSDFHSDIAMNPYLNENNMKEYSIVKKNR